LSIAETSPAVTGAISSLELGVPGCGVPGCGVPGCGVFGVVVSGVVGVSDPMLVVGAVEVGAVGAGVFEAQPASSATDNTKAIVVDDIKMTSAVVQVTG
jgi:hypothetical protein